MTAGGKLSPELTEAALMLRTGWDWDILQRQPAIVVERMVALLNAQAPSEDSDG